MMVQDLSTVAGRLRKEGFVARNLGQVGITVWKGSEGFFLSAEELQRLPYQFTPADLEAALAHKHNNGV